MILITGGAYQGKLDYAKEEFGFTDDDVFTCEETSTAVGFNEKIIYHFERYVLALIKAGQVPEKAVGMQLRANRYKGRIVICDDISQGLVPMDATERAWREGVGRTMVKMAQQADKVVRVFCGIPEVVKDAEEAPKTDGLDAVFAAEANGAVEKDDGPQKEDMPHGIDGRRNASGGNPRFSKARDAAQAFQASAAQTLSEFNNKSEEKQEEAQAEKRPEAPDMIGLGNFNFDKDDEGLTPEEQFRKMFAKMQEERKAAKKDQE